MMPVKLEWTILIFNKLFYLLHIGAESHFTIRLFFFACTNGLSYFAVFLLAHSHWMLTSNDRLLLFAAISGFLIGVQTLDFSIQ